MAFNRLYIKINNVKEFITNIEPGQSVVKNNLFIIINYNGKSITICYPWRMTDKNGRLIEPKIRENIKLDFSLDWKKSTEKSVEYFINQVQKKTFFKKKDYSKYIETLNFVYKK